MTSVLLPPVKALTPSVLSYHEWAAQLAPSYAPQINANIVGASMGGVP